MEQPYVVNVNGELPSSADMADIQKTRCSKCKYLFDMNGGRICYVRLQEDNSVIWWHVDYA